MNEEKKEGSMKNKLKELNLLLVKQKAEIALKNRELEIEAALERVRTGSMTMHNSNELIQVVRLLNKEINGLGIKVDGSQILTDFTIPQEGLNDWIAIKGLNYLEKFHIPYLDHPVTKKLYDALKKNIDYYWEKYSKSEKNKYFNLLFKYSDFKRTPNERQDFIYSSPGWTRFLVLSKNSILVFQRYNLIDFTNEEESIFKRFGKVFEQSYTRFQDLQKAEAQAREAQIEAALERVRASSMAMHQSNDLKEVITLTYDQIKALEFPIDALTINTEPVNSRDITSWIAIPGQSYPQEIYMPYFDHPIFNNFINAKKNGLKFFTEKLTKEEKDSAYKYFFKHTTLGELMTEERKNEVLAAPGWIRSVALSKNARLQALNFREQEYTDEQIDILIRFCQVFDQAYTRFLDLQKAEEQAREAQIETALERVRSRSLAMHNSDEVQEVVNIVFENLRDLDIKTDVTSVIILKEDMYEMDYWVANSDNIFSTMFRILHNDDIRILKDVMISRKKDVNFSKTYSFEEKNELWNYLFEHSDLKNIPDERKKYVLTTKAYTTSVAFTKNAAVQLNRYYDKPFTSKENEILKRFATVFEQAYIRFLDLKRAEAQAREAQIEASLERIRAQAMAMQNSNDLIKSTTILFEEFEKLNLSVDRSGIGIFDDKTRDCHLWTTVVTPDGKTELTTGITSMTRHPMLIKTFDAWKAQETLPWVLEGKELQDYYQLVSKSEFHLPDEVIKSSSSLNKEYYLYTPFGAGGLYVFSDTEPSIEEKQIIRRFADVFHLTYTRYEDLQNAETRALEAVKQASLDRVRGEIASMRTKEDLNRITPLIWKELTALGIPFIRCGVFIMNEITETIQTYLSNPEGKSLSAFEMSFYAGGIATGAVESWRKNEIFHEHWNKKDFVDFMQNLIKENKVKNSASFQGGAAPPENLHLNFVPFKQGMLYVGNHSPLSDENLEPVNSLAQAFSIAYLRYEDFKQLEEAKLQTEKTLVELKATQSQLIQSEKMASLGELTAGIAHEIQNPLNFVNNFSEVSSELIDEMNEEIDKGDIEEVKAIAGDIKQNLVKINQHGQRASGIVKGMLQHSRTSSGQKELTDINALADEYLRLSYHGIRAKDKSFNADFRLEIDQSIPKIKVVPQDIGRVLLNLINNAFYAVNEKLKQNLNDFNPEVVVSTRWLNNSIEIIVSDNGNGVPAEFLDKVFQPFFTTKPTGQGTGLGLSLSYDIVTKGHNGTMKIKTEQNKGTEFIIKLPLA